MTSRSPRLVWRNVQQKEGDCMRTRSLHSTILRTHVHLRTTFLIRTWVCSVVSWTILSAILICPFFLLHFTWIHKALSPTVLCCWMHFLSCRFNLSTRTYYSSALNLSVRMYLPTLSAYHITPYRTVFNCIQQSAKSYTTLAAEHASAVPMTY